MAERPIDNPAAYDCYLRAHHEMFHFTPASLDRAEKLADAGLAIIGENPLLLATRGLVSWYYLNFSIRPEERYLEEAASFAARALTRIRTTSSASFCGSGRGEAWRHRGGRAGHAARTVKPGDAVRGAGIGAPPVQRGSRSTRSLEDAVQIDPLNPLTGRRRL